MAKKKKVKEISIDVKTSKDETGFGLKEGIDSEGKAPKKVVRDLTTAVSMYERLQTQNLKRFYIYMKIQGMFDGNPPFDKGEQERHGLQTNSNANYRLADHILRGNLSTFHNLFNDVQHLADFQVHLDDNPELPSNRVIARIIAEEFDRIVRAWPDFYPLMQFHQAEYCKYGVNAIHWPHEKDWRFDVVDTAKFLVPEDSRIMMDTIGTVAVQHSMTAQELWAQAEKKAKSKWNKDEIKSALYHLSETAKKRGSGGGNDNAYQDWQRSIRNNSNSIDKEFNDDIELVSLYVREWSGKISRYIFAPELGSTEAEDFLYKAEEMYDSMSEIFLLFGFSSDQIYVHGNKGLGHDIYTKVQAITMMENWLVDAASRASTVLVSTKAGRGKDLKQIKFTHGGFVDIGEAEFQQNLMGANLSSNVSVINHFERKLEMHGTMSGMTPLNGGTEKKGSTTMKQMAINEARIAKNFVTYYYLQLDKLFREIFRKMLICEEKDPGYEFKKSFVDACVRRSVPEEVFKYDENNLNVNGLPVHFEVSATRANGSGSQQAQQEQMDGLMQLLPIFGERGRNNVIEDKVASLVGYRNVSRYRPAEDIAQEPTYEDTIVSIENNQLEQGENVIVSPDNNQAVHAEGHIARLEGIAKAFRAGEYTGEPNTDEESTLDPALQAADKAFQTIGPHATQHLLRLAQDPTRQSLAQELKSKWAILANFGDMLANNAQKQREGEMNRLEQKAQEMAEVNKMGTEQDPEMLKIIKDDERKKIKLAADIEKGRTRDQLKFVLDRQKITYAAENDRLKAINKIAIDMAKSDRGEAKDPESLY